MTPKEASIKYPTFIKLADDGALELYLDHHMLSTLRLCEDKFILDFCNSIEFKYGTTRKPFFLDYGEWLHYCLELFYDSWRYKNCPPLLDKWLAQCKAIWFKMNMEYFKDCGIARWEKNYDEIGGIDGVIAMLVEYYAYYMGQHMRVVATEVSFGAHKEVPIGEFYGYGINSKIIGGSDTHTLVRCYLTGRIDVVFDNGYKIGPGDHKSKASFDGSEADDYDPHEGITGYIYAMNKILRERFPDYVHKGCSGGWIYHISKKVPSTPRDKSKQRQPRFKQSPISKTPEQLEEYRLRQLRTFKKVYELVVLEETPDRNTSTCRNIFNSDCAYTEIHRQPDREKANVINQFYQIRAPWNPYAKYEREQLVKEVQREDTLSEPEKSESYIPASYAEEEDSRTREV